MYTEQIAVFVYILAGTGDAALRSQRSVRGIWSLHQAVNRAGAWV